jgi:hypothetical protein
MIRLGMLGLAMALMTGGNIMAEAGDASTPVVDVTDVNDENEAGSGEQRGTVETSVFWIRDDETVADESGKYGEIVVSSDDGVAGDEIKVFVNCGNTFDIDTTKVTFFRYALSYVTINGEKVEPTNAEKHEYVFVLKEGVNDVKAYFNGRVEISATDLSTVNWKSLLTVDNLLKLVYFVFSLALSFVFFTFVRRINNSKKKSDEEIEASVETIFAGKINDFLKETVTPIVEKQGITTKEMLDTINVLTRVTMFQLSGKPEDRLAAIKELQEYRPTNVELGEQIKKIVEDTIQKSEESKEARKKAVAEAVESVNSLGTETDKDAEIDTYDHVKL